MPNSFNSVSILTVNGKPYTIHKLSAVEKEHPQAKKLPFSLKILLENLLRNENDLSVSKAHIDALALWNPKAEPVTEVAYTPARVLMQDFTGVPCVVDLAAMRDAMKALGGDPSRINPLVPVELVIDHSVQVDEYGTADSERDNVKLEYARNEERYTFLRWGQTAFNNFKVVPPGTGICHQVNLEFLARCVFVDPKGQAYPDTLVGTDSHTTMINGLGVLGWGVGGIEAEAAMLGQPVSMLIPQVIGFKLSGKLKEGATATDLVLTVTQMLRKKGVVGKFVEFFGPGLAQLPLADRATIANMAPEYGATCGIFPVDAETLRFLANSGRPAELVALVEAYYKEQGLFHDANTPEAAYTDTLELDLATVEPSMAGPARPQDRVLLKDMKKGFADALPKLKAAAKPKAAPAALPMAPAASGPFGVKEHPPEPEVAPGSLSDGSVVIAAITSCTNTSNPSVMVAAGIVAKKAAARGLSTKPWVKTSLAPGSQVVTDYLTDSGLIGPLNQLRFNVVGYGCTTCIGNSGPLPAAVSKEIGEHGLVVSAVLSGNRNFEGRVHPEVRANYLASPPLVVAYALAGRVDIDWETEPVGTGADGQPVFLRDIWPTHDEVQEVIGRSLKEESFKRIYGSVYEGDASWKALRVPTGDLYAWEASSTYIANPPYFRGMTTALPPVHEITGARVLALLGDSITTDHISPAGNIKKDSPAGAYLLSHAVEQKDFNQYGARRGHHEVMMRGTFANVRLKNLLVPGVEGGFTRHLPDGPVTSIYEASMAYQKDGVPLVILAGKEYGSGSSRDWAAKGTNLLGVKAVIAESYERIHRSNLVGMGVLPLQFRPGESAASHGLTGEEVFDIAGLVDGLKKNFSGASKELDVTAKRADGTDVAFKAVCRIDTPQEVHYYLNGGILPYVLRQLLAGK
ncbi:aconitate hydratase : Aconitate hydratase 1 OS=Singulisphaera acidiphila (strain ATCC BAA-1392 / DSM 18658 / VKM B-2454 / MOB10) GN=Sinac_6551 PE=4 SV=1: Aconitase: Aconitase: Aconitase_C [Gemmataceae bacterium]|nr:aconitate hydratase : Aconitate hydratase 1 OS=Singulisphaera acidiphila (strain ATCC BAA-1392 / DSM 18658 / VKM B-2454 / MOB10) GN=Sinac_6551 PE=4 SV=1: Aconitase: Aconitase: Aconitase_C [Gemmataceae bacterium]VTU02359.1 aconitate hydratase : Aconitate hydratase 1 OS=Singulisphaera acidiphila (strain ATCC BAA-1392 / DSM 18658 / VKM B-2454 / MOB10) GN=Sinac_6551 PE=4 SV=1: Aconitase: Aconitase: Aconitase_C [Gemmataceae bacterium]